jgi:hypothetical protein
MPTVRDTAKLLKLRGQIIDMTRADQLRLCAGLLEQGESDIVESIAGSIVDELRARRLLRGKSVGETPERS